MIEILAVADPESQAPMLQGMYIPPKDGMFVADALEYARSAVRRMAEPEYVAARTWGVDPSLFSKYPYMYHSLVVANGRPELGDYTARWINERSYAYKDASFKIIEIADAGKGIFVPEAEVVYGGFMLGMGEMARTESANAIFPKRHARRLIDGYYERLHHETVDAHAYEELFLGRMVNRDGIVDLSQYS